MAEEEQLRQNLVNEATKFLTNPTVVRHSVEQKSAFLRKKGLTEAEITAAYERAKTYVPPQSDGGGVPSAARSGAVLPYQGPPHTPPVPQYLMPPPPSGWVRVRDACNMVLILTGASYGLYLLYQKFVKPWLTGRREKTVEESMLELQQSVVTVLKEVQATLDSLQVTLTAQSAHIQALGSKDESQPLITSRQVDQLKTEIASLKGLMIGKRTFPSTPSPASSIPSWQLTKAAGAKPLDATPQGAHSMSSQAEVTEAEVSVATRDLQEDHLNHQTQDADTPLAQTSKQVENGEAIEGGRNDNQYGQSDSDSEDHSV